MTLVSMKQYHHLLHVKPYFVNNVATYYLGDISGSVGFPIPLYGFPGAFNVDEQNLHLFLIGDLTPLSMGLGLFFLAKIVNVSIPNNNIVIQQGFEFENEKRNYNTRIVLRV